MWRSKIWERVKNISFWAYIHQFFYSEYTGCAHAIADWHCLWRCINPNLIPGTIQGIFVDLLNRDTDVGQFVHPVREKIGLRFPRKRNKAGYLNIMMRLTINNCQRSSFEGMRGIRGVWVVSFKHQSREFMVKDDEEGLRRGRKTTKNVENGSHIAMRKRWYSNLKDFHERTPKHRYTCTRRRSESPGRILAMARKKPNRVFLTSEKETSAKDIYLLYLS